MRISIPHTLGKEEVRRRLNARMGEAEGKAADIVGGMVSIDMSWVDQDHMKMDVSAMGFQVPCALEIEETALAFDVEIPAGLGFARKMIEGTIREKGEKLLT
ncbi:polyhydroxyalkanoic acid system family protein [Novosphingobium sp. KCTC 2891]|uniref:polyhydroxyalkanoic acid system family protein n=1 Tax=Novosphingobium sp. KCTC 2891 TaxID=2989730 RepID=UPI0022213542|nr:polyhydroxyalkanoic acid system family protein [Novosphingobium sp. KCTC 2891]MCW1383843.1 polyhydroxyalkanoic acid system family protein [Novosphingobium sp. KCTC 2891]